MFTMGDDFQYQNAVMNFKNMDKVLWEKGDVGNLLLTSRQILECWLPAGPKQDLLGLWPLIW
jgi:hypothetical protein